MGWVRQDLEAAEENMSSGLRSGGEAGRGEQEIVGGQREKHRAVRRETLGEVLLQYYLLIM